MISTHRKEEFFMSKEFNYKSVLAPFIKEFISIKESCGQHALRYKWILNEIDLFVYEKSLERPIITKDLIEEWRKTRINDKPSTINCKYSIWAQLARYISRHGQDCFIPKLPKFPSNTKNFTPYIFTHEQINEIFERSNKLRLQNRSIKAALFCIPTVLRLLYSTGLRISEALSIRNKDIQFDKKYILIGKTKNGSERIVPVNDSLQEVLLQYTSYRSKIPLKKLSEPDCWFFTKTDGTGFTDKAVAWWFRILMEQCGIPYIGDHHGPCVHDLRHTFAVHSLMQMSQAGMDLYTCLPIISTCLGHTSLSATEKYVRLTCEMFPELTMQCSEVNSFVYPKIIYQK